MIKKGVIFLLFLFAAYVYCAYFSLVTFANDPGVGWHLATGERVLREHAVPLTDTFLSVSRPWIADQWLSDVVLYVIYQAGGWSLLYGILTAAYLGVFFCILYLFGRGGNIAQIPLLISALCMTKLASVHFILRPVLFSFIFFALIYGFISWNIRSGRLMKHLSARYFFVTGLVFVLWANMHPSFVLGLALIVVLLAAILYRKFFSDLVIESSVTHKVLLLFIFAGLCTLLNPYGIALHKSILWLSETPYFMRLHEEWQPLSIASGEGQHFAFVLFSVLIALGIKAKRMPPIPVFEILCFALFGYLALTSVRFLPYFSIVALPVFASVVSGFFRSENATTPKVEPILYILFGVCISAWALTVHAMPLFNGYIGPSQRIFPYGVVDILKEQFPGAESLKIYTHPNYGGFLVWESRGWLKPSIDDRNTLLGEDAYRQFFASQTQNARITPFAWGYDAILLRKIDLERQSAPLEGLTVIGEGSEWVLAKR